MYNQHVKVLVKSDCDLKNKNFRKIPGIFYCRHIIFRKYDYIYKMTIKLISSEKIHIQPEIAVVWTKPPSSRHSQCISGLWWMQVIVKGVPRSEQRS